MPEPRHRPKEDELTYLGSDPASSLLKQATEQFASALISYRIAFDHSLARRGDSPARSKAEAVERLVSKGGIGRALMVLAEEVRRWATWREFGTSDARELFPAENVRTITEAENPEKATASVFDYREERFTVSIRPLRTAEDPFTEKFHVELFHGETVVLGLGAARKYQNDPSALKWTMITNFVPGDWIQSLIEIEGYINRGLETGRRAHFGEELAEQELRFGTGQGPR